MAVLSDHDIIRMFPDADPGPASLDLHIGDTLLYWPRYLLRDPRLDQQASWKTVEQEDINGPVWVLRPGLRYLAATRERITIRRDLAGLISARSSWGRDGLAVICGPAGFLDPGFAGNVVLELSVTGSDLVLWPGASVAQVTFHELSTRALRPYDGKYTDQTGPTPSRTHLEIAGVMP